MRAMISTPFLAQKKPRKHRKATPPVRVPRKHHASRQRPRIRDRTAHVRPSPYKMSPRAAPGPNPPTPRFLPFVARAPATRRRRRAPRRRGRRPLHRPRAAPTWSLPGTDRYADPLTWFDRLDLWSPNLGSIWSVDFGDFILGFDRWRRRGSWRSWRTCRRTHPPPAAQVICSLALVCVQILRNCAAIAMYASSLCAWVVDWCLFLRLVIDAVRALVTCIGRMSCFAGLFCREPWFGYFIMLILIFCVADSALCGCAYMFRKLLNFMK